MNNIIISIVVAAATSFITACFARAQLLAEYKLMFSDHTSKARYDVELEIFREISSKVIGTVNAVIPYAEKQSHSGLESENIKLKINEARKCLTSNVAFIDRQIYDELVELLGMTEAVANREFVTKTELTEKRDAVIEKMRRHFLSLGIRKEG